MRITGAKRAMLIIFAALLTACNGITGIIADIPPPTPANIPPFVITKPVFEIVERNNHFRYAGIVFKFLNHADDYIDKITVNFMLFDSKTNNSPFNGSNKFEITKLDFVSPDENKEIIISLDQYIYIAPTEPYIIDFFYVSEIHYIGGRIWQDKLGTYRVRS